MLLGVSALKVLVIIITASVVVELTTTVFVCIAQQDYWRILNHVEKNTHKVEEKGEIVMVHEHRELDRSGTRKGHIVIKVSVFYLLFLLIE